MRVIKSFVTHSLNCNIDLKGFIKIRSLLACSVSIKQKHISVFYFGEIRKEEYVITGIEILGYIFERLKKNEHYKKNLHAT